MIKKENFLLIIICLFSNYYMIISFFKDTPYITDFKKIEDYQEAIKKNELKYGFMLIYSHYCGHCRNFAPNYIKLSELFHNDLFFYALSSSSGFSKVFKIDGYPTILFYSNNTYNEITCGRKVSQISKFIRKHIQYNCTEITYNNIDLVYNEIYQKDDRNLIIGYFEENSKYLNSFKSITNNLINDYYIDLCFYCTNYKLILNEEDEKYKKLSIFQDIKENEVKSFSKGHGKNSFIFNDENEENNYEKHLFNNVINIYEDIFKGNLDILDKLKNKALVFFVYDNKDMKQKYIEIISDLYNMTINKKDNLFFYIILNKNINSPKFTVFQKNKIYLTSNDLENVMTIDDLNIIKNQILENNLKSNNELVTNLTNIENDNNNDDIIKNNNNLDTSSISLKSNDIEQKDLINENNVLKINHNISNNSNIIKTDDKKEDIIKNSQKNTNLPDVVDLPEEKDNINNINFVNDSKIIKENKNNYEKLNKTKNFINILKTGIGNNHTKNKNDKYRGIYKKNIKDNKNNKKEKHKESFNIKYILLFIVIIIVVLYFIFTKYLCVGFIKVYDSQMIEFSQPNKIEIV